ncbi:MAG TPA: hypothetical protein VHG91_14055 [Longimicrobium sp.]|nr:hypothetical protein [Longimicrobium sp.]
MRVPPLPESEEALLAMMQRLRGEWSRFHARFPGSGGVVHLSNVAFDGSRTRARAAVFRGCGPLCGYGRGLLLEKRGGDWVVLRELEVMAS